LQYQNSDSKYDFHDTYSLIFSVIPGRHIGLQLTKHCELLTLEQAQNLVQHVHRDDIIGNKYPYPKDF
jgi:hypothetical protein